MLQFIPNSNSKSLVIEGIKYIYRVISLSDFIQKDGLDYN